MTSVIRVHGSADGTMFAEPLWVEHYDLDAPPPRDKRSRLIPDGAIINGAFGGQIVLTGTRANARQFADNGEALAAWNTVSPRYPRRPDGKPNKPMSALTVEVEPW